VVFQQLVAALLQNISLGEDISKMYVRNVQVLISSDPTLGKLASYTADELLSGQRRLSLFAVLDRKMPSGNDLRTEAKQGDTQGTALSGCLALFGPRSPASVMMFWRFVETGHNPYRHCFVGSEGQEADVRTLVRMAATLGFGRTDDELEQQIQRELKTVQGTSQSRQSHWEDFVQGDKGLLSHGDAVMKMANVPENVSHLAVLICNEREWLMGDIQTTKSVTNCVMPRRCNIATSMAQAAASCMH
jgi:hypothetical protein